MDVLLPIDGSDCSKRALDFAIEFVERYDASLHLVHITDHPEGSQELVDEAEASLTEAGLQDDPEVMIDVRQFRWGDRVGKDVLGIVEDEGYDHVIIGHHGTGRIGRAILGSTAETLVQGSDVPVTVVP